MGWQPPLRVRLTRGPLALRTQRPVSPKTRSPEIRNQHPVRQSLLAIILNKEGGTRKKAKASMAQKGRPHGLCGGAGE
jgi:hypothetical protein